MTMITMQEAALYEETSYNTIKSLVRRGSCGFQISKESVPGGGKPRVMIALSSLSSKAQERYRKANPPPVVKNIVDWMTEEQEAPWYVTCDPHMYNGMIEKKGGFPTAKRMLHFAINDFLNYYGEDRTEYAQQLARKNEVSLSTFYCYVNETKRARCWVEKQQREGIPVYANYEMMALMPKPRVKNTFPSLSEEMKQRIKELLLDKLNRQNQVSARLEREQLLEDLEAESRADELPGMNTYMRYRDFLLKDALVRQACHYQQMGEREFKNKMMLKGKRSTKGLKSLEILEGDSHTLDLFAMVIDPDGTKRAIRPTLTSWIDLKTRMVHGWIISENVNARIVKESIFKAIYSDGGGVPKHLHMDNGKEYTAKETTGQARNERVSQFTGLENGFIEAMGIEGYNRSLPYQPWDKAYIERYHSTICEQFSKRFPSYVGTLTGSKTEAKVPKDIKGMLARNELPTMDEVASFFSAWLDKYHHTEHEGLKAEKETFTTPYTLMQNCERYQKAALPVEYARMQLLTKDIAMVGKQGIRRNKTVYAAPALGGYIGQKVNIFWDELNPASLYVFERDSSRMICQAGEISLMQHATHNDPVVAAAQQVQLRTLREIRALCNDTKRDTSAVTPAFIGSVSGLVPAVVAIPNDQQYKLNAKAVNEAFGTKQRISAAAYAENARRAFENNRDLLEATGT